MPAPDYKLTFALYLLRERVDTRRAFVILDGVSGAKGATIGRHFFHAMYEDPLEAQAMHEMHVDRVRWQRETMGQPSELPELE